MSSSKSAFKKVRTYAVRSFPFMLTCRELEGFITDYLDGTLPNRQRRRFELHLALCRECRRYLERYKQIIALSREAFRDPDAEVPEDVPAELVEAILRLRETSSVASSRDAAQGPGTESAHDVQEEPVETNHRQQEKND